MRSILCTKPFFTRNQLNTLKIEQYEKLTETFNKSKKSSNNDIVSELYSLLNDHLNSTFKVSSEENDARREQWGKDAIDKYTSIFNHNINGEIGSVYVEPQNFEEIVTKNKQNVIILFNEVCGDDKDMLFVSYFKVSYSILTMFNKFKYFKSISIAIKFDR